MKTAILPRLVAALARPAVVLALGSALGGCAAARATFNFDAGWAISEPTPMSVVMHRGAVARDVATQTDEMLRTLPADEASGSALAMDEPEARSHLAAAGLHHAYAELPVRVVPAEAWKLKLASTCTEPDPDAALIARLGGDAVAEFDRVDAMVKAAAASKAGIAVARRDARKAKGDAKEPHKARVGELKDKLKGQKEALKPAMKAMVEQLETTATALPAQTKQELAPVVFNLLAAVKDAESANAAAILRYPMALSKLPDELQPTVGRLAADVIEDQTGQRPDTKNMQIEVGLEGGKVKLKIAGLDQDAMGELKVGEVIKETSKRTKAYVKDVFVLPGKLDETAERLLFQKRVLKAVAKGLEAPADGVTKINKLKLTAAEAAQSGAGQAEGEPSEAVACETGTDAEDELEDGTDEAPSEALL